MMSNNAAIPVEIAAAIVKVMAGIKVLGKEDTNKFQKYDFVSVDKFLAAVAPLCVAADLVILQEEESVDVSTRETTDDYGKTKSSAWLTARYAFTFVHASGAAYGPLHRSVMVPANGAQAFGSAQSYALKQFMRAQFQIPTGDKDDADHMDAAPLPRQMGGNRPQPRPQAAPEQENKPQTKAESKADFWGRQSFDLDPKGEKTPLEFAGMFERALASAPAQHIDKLVRDNDLHLDGLISADRDRGNALLLRIKEAQAQKMAA